jgi:hypothetical protein
MNTEPEMPQGKSEEPQGAVKNATVTIPFPETFAYANCAAFAISQMEIRIGFAEAMHNGTAVPKAGIVLPPEAAAVVALVLLRQVKIYEENFREIQHPLWKAMKQGLELDIKDGVVGGASTDLAPAEPIPQE